MAGRAAIWALAVGQTLGYASFYYIFPALVLSMHEETGWTKAALAIGPTTAIMIAGVLAPFMGRLVDRGQSLVLLGMGPVLGAGALAVLASSETTLAYLLAWAGLGIAQAASLYEVSFAFLVRRLGAAARAAIVRVTLVAGFAGTLAFPAGAVLSDSIGWRGAVWVACSAAFFAMAPMQAWAVRCIRRGGPVRDKEGGEQDRAALGAALKRPVFWILGGMLGGIALNHWMVMAFFVPAFVQMGAAETLAVLAASLVGPAQVAGRLALLRVDARLGNDRIMQICLAGMMAAVFIFFAAGLSPILVVAYAVIQGASIGTMTILRPVLIADVLGPYGYGSIAGMIQVLPLMAAAAAPLVGALVLAGAGPYGLASMSAALMGLTIVAAGLLRRATA